MKFWNRQGELIVGSKKYDFDDFEIEFNVPSTVSEEPDIAEIKIYNLTDTSLGQIKNKSPIFLNAGYGEDIGNIFTGHINDIQTTWSDVDKITTILAADKGANAKQSTINKTYKAGTKASVILRDLANLINVKVEEIKPVNDITYKKGKVVKGNIYNHLKAITKETKSKMYISKGRLYIRSGNKGTQTGFVLNSKSGLVGSPERNEEEVEGKKVITYNVTSILNHKIKKDSVIKVESRSLKGQFIVLECTHTSDFDTQLKVKPYG